MITRNDFELLTGRVDVDALMRTHDFIAKLKQSVRDSVLTPSPASKSAHKTTSHNTADISPKLSRIIPETRRNAERVGDLYHKNQNTYNI